MQNFTIVYRNLHHLLRRTFFPFFISIIFCLFYFLMYLWTSFVLSYLVLSYLVLFYLVLSCYVLLCFVLFCFVFSCIIWFWIILIFSFNRNDYIYFNNNSSRASSLQFNNMWIRNTKETINDANDRAIRTSCLFFQKMVDGYGKVVLVTNDTDNQVNRKKYLCLCHFHHLTSVTMPYYFLFASYFYSLRSILFPASNCSPTWVNVTLFTIFAAN